MGTASSRIGMHGRFVVAIEPDLRTISELYESERDNPRHEAYSDTRIQASPSVQTDFSSGDIVDWTITI